MTRRFHASKIVSVTTLVRIRGAKTAPCGERILDAVSVACSHARGISSDSLDVPEDVGQREPGRLGRAEADIDERGAKTLLGGLMSIS